VNARRIDAVIIAYQYTHRKRHGKFSPRILQPAARTHTGRTPAQQGSEVVERRLAPDRRDREIVRLFSRGELYRTTGHLSARLTSANLAR
jgi:hypothetical protein